MKQPAFWYRSKSVLGWILSPLGKLYERSIRRRFAGATPYQPHVPVICVGNIAVGGTGKTPVALSLAAAFLMQNKKVVFLNHGYKSKRQAHVVNLETDRSEDVSDEALLLAQKAPTVIDSNRGRGVAKAEKMGADIIIMDDGFQNPSVIKTVSLVVFDGARGIGNGYCLPAGPLRESLEQGLLRADAVVFSSPDQTHLTTHIQSLFPQIVILNGHMALSDDLKGVKGIAFAGLGHPDKFFNSLKNAGVHLIKTIVFPDHHAYTALEIEKLIDRGYPLLTTTKDAVKIPKKYHSELKIVAADFVWDEPNKWADFLEKEMP